MGPNPKHNLMKKKINVGTIYSYEQNNIGYDKEFICFRGKLNLNKSTAVYIINCLFLIQVCNIYTKVELKIEGLVCYNMV